MKIPAWMVAVHETTRCKVVAGDTITFTDQGRLDVPVRTKSQAYNWNTTGIPLLLMLMDHGPRFFRECYIDTDIHWVRSEGMMDLAHIFIEANGMRWAVLRNSQDDFILADLWETTTREDNTVIELGPVLTFRDLDAAIAAARLHT